MNQMTWKFETEEIPFAEQAAMKKARGYDRVTIAVSTDEPYCSQEDWKTGLINTVPEYYVDEIRAQRKDTK
jgi:hypothetical protein